MTGFAWPRARAQLDLLVESPHAPLERELRRVLRVLEAAEPEAVDEVGADQVGLRFQPVSSKTPRPTARIRALLVADDEAGAGAG